MLILIMLLSGCASVVPTAINNIPAPDISVDEVRVDIEKFYGSRVRWGGVISKVENKAEQTWIEVVSRKLSSNGQPSSGSKSSGRFIARFSGFVDPLEYKVGALLTVAGSLTGEHVALIGEYLYSFPVVTVSAVYLWPPKQETVVYHDHPLAWGLYDPWPYHYTRYPPSSRW
ncbi:Slp family lipoprotein [Psychromonas sp.]|uniref:Slp family lipoprotein n=1 Tax=Psychromonas sp. TaxID=1884585 RepID=UPI0039E4CF06